LIEWRLTPEYINENWTDEEFTLMVEKLNGRKQREIDAMQSRGSETDTMVSDAELFKELGNKIKVGG
jgi:hypothetical protein